MWTCGIWKKPARQGTGGVGDESMYSSPVRSAEGQPDSLYFIEENLETEETVFKALE